MYVYFFLLKKNIFRKNNKWKLIKNVRYYSMYGHLQALARQVVLGLEKSGGIYFFNFQSKSFFEYSYLMNNNNLI